jgi:hypothetical protein
MDALVAETAMVKALQAERERADDQGEATFTDLLDAAIGVRLDRIADIVAEMKARNATE